MRSYRGPEKEHFNKTQRCKVTSNQEQYTMHSKQQINWLERDNCRITKNGADYSIHNKKPLNWLERHDCRVTKNFQERNGFKFVRVKGSSRGSSGPSSSSTSKLKPWQSNFNGKKPINHLTNDKCRITKNNDDYDAKHFRRPINHLEHDKCRITQNYDVFS